MTFEEAAYEILKQAGQPLHYREITERALQQGLIESTGKTPAATLNSQIAVSIKNAREGGPPSRFYRAGRGILGLVEWEETGSRPVPAARPTPPPPPAPEPEPAYLSYKDAALKVLQAAGQPLHYKEIAQRAIGQALINPQGLTPDATMGSQLYTDIKQKGAESLFRREGRGLFGLAEWQKGTRGILRQVAKQRREVKKELLERLLQMPPAEFELLVGRLLGTMGYEDIQVTKHSSDGGVDVLADIEVGVLKLRTAVQVKRLKANVRRPIVSQLRGDMALWEVEQGMVITTSDFSEGAKQVARLRNVTPISLINGDRLTDLLIQYGIGVRKDQIELVTFDPDRLWEEE